MSILIKSATILDSLSSFNGKKVDIFIKNGRITQIGKSIKATAKQTISSPSDLYVSQGWVDVFADYCEPGYEHNETIATGMKAAAKGGFTDVLLVPNTQPAITSKSMVEALHRHNRLHAVQLHALGAVTKNIEGKELAEMMDMRSAGAAAFSDGWKPIQDAGLMLKALEYVKAFDGIIVQIPLHASLTKGGLMHEGPISMALGMPGVPPIAEALIIHRDIELLRYTDSRLHITGVSSAQGLRLIKAAKKEGLQITCSVTPYHLLYTDKDLQTYNSLYKVEPVLRDESDRKALIKGLEDGTIDCIASHHRPKDWDAKTKEYEYAEAGMITQETMWSMLLTAAPNISPERWSQLLTENPRTIFGLKNTTIEKDSETKLTVFDTNTTWKYEVSMKQSLGINSPLLGQELKGLVYEF